MLTAALPADPGLRVAFEEALAGYREGGLPIGAALFHRGELIGRGRNRRVQDGNPILHAEMTCFQNAGRLPASVYREAPLYSTLSPSSTRSGPALLVDINRVPHLAQIEVGPDHIRMGALGRQEQARLSSVVRAEVCGLSQALDWVASPVIRERGTVVGNLIANTPGAELPAVAIALGAS